MTSGPIRNFVPTFSQSEMSFLVYGSYGYTGRLIVKLAIEKGLAKQLIIGGRDREKVMEQAQLNKLTETRIFSVEDEDYAKYLDGVSILLNCAGPFDVTCKLFVEACITKKCHYLDITGEIDVFEQLATFDQQAKDAGIIVLPGTGFDVVPSDCLAAKLKEALPDADVLEMAFQTRGGGMSRGTLMTMVKQMFAGSGFRDRVNGKIQKVTPHFKEIKLHGKSQNLAAISWGDVSTAYVSTGIPNISVYTGFSKPFIFVYYYFLAYVFAFVPFLGSILLNLIWKYYDGPALKDTEKARVQLYGIATNKKGVKVERYITMGEPYRFTAEASLSCVEKILNKKTTKRGFLTPSLAFGSGFINEFEGVVEEKV
jgi:short subunit dehydrogenase-like uncharacterized protein